MKKLERIFLYTVLAILVFYVFLVDGNVESQGVIQEEIWARSIVIVNDAGQSVIWLSTDEYGGKIQVYNKDGNTVAYMGADEEYKGMMSVYNKTGNPVAAIGANKDGGTIGVCNKAGDPVAGIIANKDGDGRIGVWNKSGKRIGSLP